MLAGIKIVGQIALGVFAGSVASDVVDKVVDKVKKVVVEKKEKSRN